MNDFNDFEFNDLDSVIQDIERREIYQADLSEDLIDDFDDVSVEVDSDDLQNI